MNLFGNYDIELYNSAHKAKVYNIHDKVRLKSDGHILWLGLCFIYFFVSA